MYNNDTLKLNITKSFWKKLQFNLIKNYLK